MISIEFSRRQIIVFYLVVVAADLFFIGAGAFQTTPGMVVRDPISVFINHQLDLTTEQTIATWYSSVLLLFAGLTALLNARTLPPVVRLKWLHRVGWVLTAALFAWLSADETAAIHEMLAPLLNQANAGQSQSYRIGAGDWLPILLPFIVASVVGLTLFFFASFYKKKYLIVLGLAGLCSWAGAIYAEAMEARIIHSAQTGRLERVMEECFEIIGTTIFLITFVEFYKWRCAQIVRAKSEKESAQTDQETSEKPDVSAEEAAG